MTNEFHSECSSSTSRSSQPDTEDDKMIALMLSEEYSKLDGTVARRLSNLAPIPVVPRINSFYPTLSDANLDHQRLHQRYAGCRFMVSMRSVCLVMEIVSFVHSQIRCSSHLSITSLCVKKWLNRSGEWGDHVTLQAAADRFAAKICLLTSFRDTCFIEIVPQNNAPQRELWLSFWSEVHYNSLYDLRDAPLPKPRKKHWLF
ncbi:hypothetical protein RND81_02G168400 [Saponaria officinalis]|uniref:OTU domain-containing protein n=1 Tax=Saponaria officinalis TaxID=3572 RepID=A0AAW1MM51_SAPOF